MFNLDRPVVEYYAVGIPQDFRQTREQRLAKKERYRKRLVKAGCPESKDGFASEEAAKAWADAIHAKSGVRLRVYKYSPL